VLSRHKTEVLLSRLCVDLGFCLPPTEQMRLIEKPPKDVQEFTDAVFFAEGLDPTIAERHLYRQVRDMILAAFQESAITREGDA
jgi:hypothetical protein